MTSAEQAYLFRHGLMRDAAYELQPPAYRARLHGEVLRIFEAMHNGPPPPITLSPGEAVQAMPHPLDQFATELAEHALRGQGLTQNLVELRKLQELYLQRAAWRAGKDYHTHEALELWTKLIELANDDRRRGTYLVQSAQAAMLAANPAQAEALARNAVALAKDCADPSLEGAALPGQ